MLVIISDLHFTDESCSASIPSDAISIFAQRLCESAIQASWRTDQNYRPIDRIDLVLLGDILDIIRSARWSQAPVRPWDDCQSPEVVETVTSIVDDILQRNRGSLHRLRQLAAEGVIRVPAATSAGRPDHQAGPISVPVRTYYMVGNHDWPLHLRGTAYDLVRQKVAHQMGLSNRHTAPFPHDPVECDQLLDTLRRHRVFARHGDIYDPLNFIEERDASSLGDAIVIEQLIRFTSQCERSLGEDLPAELASGLHEIHNVRPVLLVPIWIEGLLERCCTRPAVRKQIKSTWDGIVDQLLQLPMVTDRSAWNSRNLTDGLDQIFSFKRRTSSGWASKVTRWLQDLRGASSDSYFEHAAKEQDFRNRRARHIVYGHTHHAETVPLDASYADSFVLNQIYFNAGTWRRTHLKTVLAPMDHEFIPAESMNIVAFYQGDERAGHPYETWSGSLGARALEMAIDRPVEQNEQQSSEEQASQQSLSIGPPHFVPATAPGQTIASVWQ